ncbi:MAG: hypothetical protein ACRD19_01580 [Terriglobia bacterium]
MDNVKRLLLRSAGLGAGFAIVGAIIIGTAIWWMGRPAKPKPWNRSAITATYDTLQPIDDGAKLQFSYILENHTDADFRVDSDASIHLGAQLAREKSLSFDEEKGFLEVAYPIFVPARSRARFAIVIPYPYPVKDDPDASPDQRHDYTTKLARFVTSEMSNLNGFVLMDDGTRYEIDMPNGWAQRVKEPMKAKAPGDSK